MSAEIAASRSVLRLEALEVRFSTSRGEVAAVRELSLSVAAGECLAVVGESGAGKSQAFLAVLGLLAANGRVRGSARFQEQNLIGLGSTDLDRIRGSRIGMVFQDPMTSLTPHLRIGDQIAEPLMRHAGLSWQAARVRGLALLQQVHVTDPQQRLQQYPHELSGGMRQRVAIAIALCCNPTLLIADEPTTALDVTIQAQILALLVELKAQRGMSMVLITHDLGVVAGIADRVAVLQAGRLVEQGSVGQVLCSPQHPYTRALLAAVPRVHERPGGHAPNPAPAAPDLRISELCVQFKISGGAFGRNRVLQALAGVDLQVGAAEAVGIVGESGSGKSTLARCTVQLVRAHSGRIEWLGRSLGRLTQRQLRPLRRELQMIFQDATASLDPRMTVREIIAEPLRLHRPDLNREDRLRSVAGALRRVGLAEELGTRYPHELSGGQGQRVGIARAMVVQPRLLICDEPVSALDVTVQAQVLALLEDLKREFALGILFISHNLAVVQRLCDRVLVLYLGRMMESAPTAVLFAQPLHPYTRQLLHSAPIPDPQEQPRRLRHTAAGEAPSPLDPPSGCVFRTRCPHVIELCREQIPRWEQADSPSHHVACHRWRELASQFRPA